eukprot:5630-Chlamydomonas_euryale.AAC.1
MLARRPPPDPRANPPCCQTPTATAGVCAAVSHRDDRSRIARRQSACVQRLEPPALACGRRADGVRRRA